MEADRFDYTINLSKATSYRGRRSVFWPPADSYAISCINLASSAPSLGDGFVQGLSALRAAIDTEWLSVKEHDTPARARFRDPLPIAEAMRCVGEHLLSDVDRQAITLRARAVEDGYDASMLAALSGLQEDVAVIAGQISTWYGKEPGGLPTAFACQRDDVQQHSVADALTSMDDVSRYLAQLHADLCLGDLPAFAATRLFFMAGEGNLHPKHIAYFLPEDEGVKRSPFKKTYYFVNTHRALLQHFSAPLASRFLNLGVQFDPSDTRFHIVPTLGVFAHELGHFVRRPATDYSALNASSRWASVVLQEIAADVFGTLILAEVWAERFNIPAADVIAYYLAECLRYMDRGLGYFPDSDGMFLQLSYFVQLGALTLEQDQFPHLTGNPEAVTAGLRSLARVLADALLAGKTDPAITLHRTFGPARTSPLQPLLRELGRLPSKSVEYVQDHVRIPQLAVTFPSQQRARRIRKFTAIADPKQDLDGVRSYYCSQRSLGDMSMSIYEIWENGGAFHDSVTPSTYCPEYRSHIVLKILSLTPDNANIFSLGCGNGFVEGDLAHQHRGVRAIDCNEDAVLLTRRKGVDAFTADFFGLEPVTFAEIDLVYADGLIGHLFHPKEQLTPFLSKLKALKLKPGTRLVISNDSPRDPCTAFAQHEKVEGFWFVSKDYLRDSLSSFGFDPMETYYFPYLRPVSGIRNRTVCIARVPPASH